MSSVETRAFVALAAFLLYGAIAFGLRTYVHRRRTGSSGFHGVTPEAGALGRIGAVAFVLALVASGAAPVLALLGVVSSAEVPVAQAIAGLAAIAAGTAGTWAAQAAMGASWRIGVRAGERTELRLGGPFRVVRNPIFSSMIVASLGVALLVPNAASIAGALALIAAVELQVRFVEEPHLMRTHGPSYAAYARAVGRFVPLLGRLSDR